MTDNDLTHLPGVGPTIAGKLRDAGYTTPDDVLEASVDELAEVDMIGTSTSKGILEGDRHKTRGRPDIVEDHIDEICELAELPISDRGVIRLSPIGWSTHKEWRNKYEEYDDAWGRHRAKAELKLAEEVAVNDPRFLLERAFGYTKEQTVEHTGDGLDLSVTSDEKEQLDELFNRDPQ